ncbi:MAG: exodeoxyribonuclease VII large subunit [Syntrophales bacterium]|nr:exodeoxyribonuclease VII large subunit [Syntrophales bacterium]
MKDVWTVSELNEDIKNLLYDHYGFLWVEGEVSDLRRPSSGHLYFYLKDEKSRIRAVIFRPMATPSGFTFDLEDGMHITCRARLSVYSPRGEYQLIVDRLEPLGLGALKKAYEQLKARLEKEGLFDAKRKKPLPFLPERIGIVTSPSGAVIRDILNITARRFPSINIVIAPVRVQGMEAPAEIVEAIAQLNLIGVDVIIIARGGGSFEDLYPFNTEEVARAVFASQIPVVSAIGHETDFTITDFVADLRAPTPSAAAELVVPAREDLLALVRTLSRRLKNSWRREMDRLFLQILDLERRLSHPKKILDALRIRIEENKKRLYYLTVFHIERFKKNTFYNSRRLLAASPHKDLEKRKIAVMSHRRQLYRSMLHRLHGWKQRLASISQLLETLSPLATLERGYSITTKIPEGWIIRDARTVYLEEHVRIRLCKGYITAQVKEVE